MDNSISQKSIDMIREYFNGVLTQYGLDDDVDKSSINSLIKNMLNRLHNLDNRVKFLEKIDRKYKEDRAKMLYEIRGEIVKEYGADIKKEEAANMLKDLSLAEVALLLTEN